MTLTQLKKHSDNICGQYGVSPIKIKVNNAIAKNGLAYYATYRIRGKRINHPCYIMIQDWNRIMDSNGEIAHRLGHELAHHVLNTKHNSLAHDNRHSNLEDIIGFTLSKAFK